MKRTSSVILGLVIILAGVFWGLKELGITDVNIFFDGWWTLFIIIPCAVGLFTSSDKYGNLVFLIIGVLMLLACNDAFENMWKIILPVLVIACGLKLVFGGKSMNKDVIRIADCGSKTKYEAVFSGQELDFTNEVFEGGEFNAVFGGIECDMRNAIIDRDVVIKAKCAFGCVEICLPENVNVKASSNSIFGGVEMKKHNNKPENTVTVYIESTCAFGGIEVK